MAHRDRTKKLAPVIEEANRLLEIVAGEATIDVREMGDAAFLELTRLGSKSLHIRAMMKAMEAIEAIDLKKLAAASPVAAATVAGILIDKAAGPLSVMSNMTEEDPTTVPTLEGIQALMGSIRGKMKTLEATGIRITVEDPAPAPALEPYKEVTGIVGLEVHEETPTDS